MKNKYEVRGEVTAIFLKSKKYGYMETLISTTRLDKVKSFPNSWHVQFDRRAQVFYVCGSRPYCRLHRWLTDATDEMVVDHKNHSTLDNTDDNIRVVTQAENTQNKNGSYKNSASGIRGVSWHKKSGRWIAQIQKNKTKIHIGIYESIEEAEKAVKEAREKYMPYSQEASA